MKVGFEGVPLHRCQKEMVLKILSEMQESFVVDIVAYPLHIKALRCSNPYHAKIGCFSNELKILVRDLSGIN